MNESESKIAVQVDICVIEVEYNEKYLSRDVSKSKKYIWKHLKRRTEMSVEAKAIQC